MQRQVSWISRIVCAVVACVSVASATLAGQPLFPAWTTQCGTPEHDRGCSLAVTPSGATYVTGHTWGDFAGPSANFSDVILVKFDSNGTELWRRQFGTDSGEGGECVAVDASGAAYVGGQTEGTLIGANAGYTDAFLVKFDVDGNELWRQQFGRSHQEEVHGVAVNDAGAAYVVGQTDGLYGAFPDSPYNAGTFEGFLTKYDTNGTCLWYKQYPAWHSIRSVAIDASGNVFIAAGSDNGPLVKFDADGNELWSQPVFPGTNFNTESVAVNAAGAVYVAGNVDGSHAGCYVAKLTASGDSLWVRQFQISGVDLVRSLAVDGAGSAHVVGHGDDGDFLVSYDTDGNQLSSQIATPPGADANAIALDATGAAYIAGQTYCPADEGWFGNDDVLLMKFSGMGLPGDADNDGDVDLDDFVIFKNGYGKVPAERSDGDVNGDGKVNLDDFVLIKTNFGRTIHND